MENSPLINKSCKPCSGKDPSLAANDIQNLLSSLDAGWGLSWEGHLERRYVFRNFKMAMDFANCVAGLAEEEGHHPDLTVGWGFCTVTLWTHKIGGLSENDFILAAKIDGA